MAKKKQKLVGVLGGTFDPPHIGHVNVASLMLARGLVEEVHVFPVAEERPGKSIATPFRARFHMTQLAFQHLPRVTVRDSMKYKKMGVNVDRTYDLMQFMADDYEHPILMVGSDITRDQIENEWYRGKDLLADFTHFTFPRGIIPCSSSSIRKMLATDAPLAYPWLNLQVLLYIYKNKKYDVEGSIDQNALWSEVSP